MISNYLTTGFKKTNEIHDYLKKFDINPELIRDKLTLNAVWDNFVYMRKSPRGKHIELWHHISGCRQWFKVQRDTATHEIFKTAKMSEEIT